MIKQLVLLVILILGIGGTVLVVQKSTLLQSFGYDVVDFVYAFHSSEGDAEFNSNLDIYKDGIINVMDILKDRYAQEATRTGDVNQGTLTGILDSSQSAQEASTSGGAI